jgi:Glycosyl transferase family group 2
VILPSGSSLDSMDSPAATLVIISHNRPKLRDLAIRSALDSMANARVKLPIVVIDSTKVPGPTPPGIHLMHRPDAPTCVAKRRLAVETSQTEWVLMLDDDCQVVPDGIGRMLSAIAAEDGNLTGAIFVVTEFSGDQTWMFRAASHSDLLLGFGDTAEIGDITWAITTFSAFRRSAVLKVDAFSWDEFPLQAGGEDVDACMRLRAGGWKLRGLPDTLALHDTQTWDSFRKNARRSRNYGAAEGELVRLHPRRTRLGWENLLVSTAWGAVCARLVGGRRVRFVPAALVGLLSWFAGEATELAGRHREASVPEIAVQTAWSLLYEIGRLGTAARRYRSDLVVRRYDWASSAATGFSARIGPGMAKRMAVTGGTAVIFTLMMSRIRKH